MHRIFHECVYSGIKILTCNKSILRLNVLGVLPLAFLLVGLNTKPSLKETITKHVSPISKVKILQEDNRPSISPLRSEDLVRMSSSFGQRIHPVTKKQQHHTGVDFSAPKGAPVFSTADGVITLTDNDDKRGNYIHIKHSEKYQTAYFHLSEYIVDVDTKVKKGDIIGYVGDTGLSFAPHLHYEVRVNGKPVNPVDFLSQENN